MVRVGDGTKFQQRLFTGEGWSKISKGSKGMAMKALIRALSIRDEGYQSLYVLTQPKLPEGTTSNIVQVWASYVPDPAAGAVMVCVWVLSED
jgi:hypothetical protein